LKNKGRFLEPAPRPRNFSRGKGSYRKNPGGGREDQRIYERGELCMFCGRESIPRRIAEDRGGKKRALRPIALSEKESKKKTPP